MFASANRHVKLRVPVFRGNNKLKEIKDMQMKRSKKRMSFILCMALIVAMALFTNGCNGNTGKDTSSGAGTETNVQSEKDDQTGNDAQSGEDGQTEDNAQSGQDGQTEGDAQGEYTRLGEGNTKFMFTVVDKDGGETRFEIHTDKETVGEALVELELIAGDESEYGLYVKTVNGITADYDADGTYWAFYINDEYAMTGVDATTITEGDSYSFKVE